MFPTTSPFMTDYSLNERRIAAFYSYGSKKPPFYGDGLPTSQTVPVPNFTKAAKPALNLGTGSFQLSNYAGYKVTSRPGGVSLAIEEAHFTAKALRELTTHLTALAAAMDATQ